MSYTVANLAKISGVSVRTLHWYDELGLLKPAYHGANGYRYYEEEQLMILQQILFFRELGFELKQIKKIIGRSDFDKRAALSSHRQLLQKDLERIRRLIKTIDHTLEHLKGTKKMNDKEFFVGFSLVTKAKSNESYFAAEELVGKSVKKPILEKQEPAFYENISKKANVLFGQVADCLENGLKPTSIEVQRLIKKHHSFLEQFSTATKEVYKAYAQLYLEHPTFRKQLDPIHPQLAEFMSKAMKIFAERELT